MLDTVIHSNKCLPISFYIQTLKIHIMKRNIPSMAMFLSIAAFMSSCSTINKIQVEPIPVTNHSKENTATCFVQHMDGSIQQYTSLKLVTGIFTSPYLLADGKIKINASGIKAYQNQDHYAVSQLAFETGHKSKVAKESLPGFAVRIAQGNLNVYSKKYYNGTKAVDELFIQSGSEGKIMAYTPAIMNELIKDHPEALNLLNSKKKINPVSKKLLAVAEVYNRGQMMSKN